MSEHISLKDLLNHKFEDKLKEEDPTERYDFFKLETKRPDIEVNPQTGKIPLLYDSFTGLIIGKPGSGKTSLFMSLLNKEGAWKYKFDDVLFISPAPIKGVPTNSPKFSQQFDLDWIDEQLLRISQRITREKLANAKAKKLQEIVQKRQEKFGDKPLNLEVGMAPVKYEQFVPDNVIKGITSNLGNVLFEDNNKRSAEQNLDEFEPKSKYVNGQKVSDEELIKDEEAVIANQVDFDFDDNGELIIKKKKRFDEKSHNHILNKQADCYNSSCQNYISNPDHETKVLVCVDDFIAKVKDLQNNQRLITMLYNRRKMYPNICVSWLFTTQKYKLLANNFRAVLDFIMSFGVARAELEAIKDEHIYDNEKVILGIIMSHFKKDVANLVYFDLKHSKIYLNFDTLIT